MKKAELKRRYTRKKIEIELLRQEKRRIAEASYHRADITIGWLKELDPLIQVAKLKLPVSERGDLLKAENYLFEILTTNETFKQMAQNEAGGTIHDN